MAKKKDVEKAFPKTDREQRDEFYALLRSPVPPTLADDQLHALLKRSHYLSDEERKTWGAFLTRENLDRFPDLMKKFRYLFDKAQFEAHFPKAVTHGNR